MSIKNISNPCSQRWEDLTPRPDGRHCDSCKTTVIDFTRLTRKQARDVIRASDGRVCARIRTDANGETLFRPEPRRVSLAATKVAAGALLVAACAPEAKDHERHTSSTTAPVVNAPPVSAPLDSPPPSRVPSTPADAGVDASVDLGADAARRPSRRRAHGHPAPRPTQELEGEFMGMFAE